MTTTAQRRYSDELLAVAQYYARQAPSPGDDDPFGDVPNRPEYANIRTQDEVNPIGVLASQLGSLAEEGEPAPAVREAAAGLAAMVRTRVAAGPFREGSDWQFHEDWLEDLDAAAAGGIRRILDPGEAWSDAAIADIGGMEPGAARTAWVRLFEVAEGLGNGKPAQKWAKSMQAAVEAVGLDAFKAALVRWFPLVDRPRTAPHPSPNPWDPDWDLTILPSHVGVLRGLAFACRGVDDREVARALARLAVGSYRKIPGVGPRLISLGNACVATLGTLPGVEPVGQLAMLKTRIKFGTAQKEVEKAFDAAARRENLPREEIEELAVPAYGMEEVGRRREEFGDYAAEMVADSDGVEVRWTRAGAPLKSAPAPVRKGHAAEFKELQGAAKDAEAMLATVRDRLDSLFLARKSWPLATWRERYLDHPLAGVVARRLIWAFEDGGQSVDGVFADGRIEGLDGREVEGLGESARVSPWHPIGRPVGEVLAWRDRLEVLGIRQPFKQAHREVYPLTDAERRTGTYSNRFAAHVLKQHQFNALGAARGWKHKLRLSVDDSYPPASRALPEWGLRAEFWVEGVGDSEDGLTESGAYLHLATDQVRFYPLDAPQAMAHASGGGYSQWRGEDRPLALEDVPPLVLSEVMRDVDLFVGVGSVGNDPTWSDGGPRGRYVDYWHRYSFGDLSATARTRKEVLERLVPRLKVADRCSFSDRYLVVRGDLRTYKIHLGSGNILMEPNDQYLCIVPRQAATPAGPGAVFLPFEGDGLLSIILSKALLLADDRKIKDTTITRQIVPGS